MSKRKVFSVVLLAFIAALMLACAVFFTACGNNETQDDGHNTEQGGENPGGDDEPGTDPDDDTDIAVTTVSLDKNSLTLRTGESYTLIVTVSPSNATDKSIIWSSANSSVASVSAGKVTAKSEGTTTITATAHNGKKASCTVTVNELAPEVIEVTSVALNKTSLTLEIGACETLTATVSPSNATDKSVTWTSSAQSVATVANGKITAVGSGTATITATTSNGKTATCAVTVNAAVPKITQVEGATIDGTDIFMLVDHTTDSVALLNKVTVSSGSWDLYSDILGQNRIPTKIAAGSNGKLQNGNNVFYIMLENENGDLAEVYTLTVYRSYAVTVSYYNHKDVLVYSDTAYTGYEYALNYEYTTPGYTFNNWTENGVAYQARVLWDKLNLYADMTANSYTVTLDANGGKVAEETQTVNYDDSYAFPVPVRTGYTFLGWYSGDVLLADAEDETSSIWCYTDIVSATAKWQINQYTLTTEGLSAAGTFTEGGTYDYGTKLNLTASSPNLGYDFLGWYEGDTCLTAKNNYTFTLPDKDIVLTAKYEVNAEMTPFYFNSTQTECVITGVRDTSIKEIIVPDYVVKIENAAFRDCSDLTSVAIPESVTSIGSNAFYGCRALTSVTIPDGLTNIESSMFNGCSSLMSITIPENVTSIGSYAFYGCSSLTSVTIPDGVMSIGSFAFSNCSGLTEIKFNAVSVADASSSGVFGENTGIENGLTVIFGNSVQRIPDYLFYHCDNLTSVTIGDSITSIGKSAFSFCSGLTEIKFNAISMEDFTSSNSVFENIRSENSLTVVFGKSVQRIPDYLFYRCDELTSLMIGNNVTWIGSYAFCGCDGLTSVIIPDSVTSIGDSVFDACSKLTNVTIGKNVKNLGKSVFRDCSELTEIKFNAVSMEDLTSAHNILEKGGSKDGLTVIFGDDVQRIPGYLFYTPDFVNDRLQGVKIPASVTCIGASAFKGQLVRSLYINDLTAWCNMSFEDDNSRPMGNHPSGYSWGGVLYLNDQRITDLVIPDGITHIRDYLFEGITNLKHVTISNTVTNIGNGAFYGCSGLTSISIPDSVMSIGTLAFADCSGLSSISIPDSVTSLGSYLFRDCSKLKSITIPDSVTCIDTNVFSGCDGLTSITIPFVGEKADGTGKVHFGYIFGASRSINNADYVPASLKEVIITGGSSIEDSAFSGCSGLTSITIPASVTSIGSAAFYDCSGLTSITIPDSVASIGGAAFEGCSRLTSVIIPNGITSIEGSVFYGCSRLTSIIIPGSVTSIGYAAFAGCSGLTSISIPDSVISIGRNAFSGCNALQFNADGNAKYLGNITNPYLVLYKVNDNKITSFEIKSQTKVIYSDAFKSCSNLTSITILDGMTTIGDYAFNGCASLTNITIPNSVTSIGSHAFEDCSRLTSITIPDSVTRIGEYAFYNCSGLTSIAIPDSVISIEILAFYGCSGIIQIENGVQYVDKWVIDCDTSVNYVTLRENTVGIAASAFSSCSRLISITIPDGLISIGDSAFDGCSSLTSITIPDSLTSIGSYAFEDCSGLTRVIFENPNGWCRTSSSAATGGTSVSSSDIADPSIAATYLKSTYAEYYWKRG